MLQRIRVKYVFITCREVLQGAGGASLQVMSGLPKDTISLIVSLGLPNIEELPMAGAYIESKKNPLFPLSTAWIPCSVCM